MALLGSIRSCVEAEINRFDAADGVGPDYSCERPMAHAMAEGRFLAALGELADASLISPSSCATLAAKSIDRLDELRIPANADEAAWGLRFPWAETGPDEPFVVTTALVVEGLHAVGGRGVPGATKLLESGRRWLLAAPQRFGSEGPAGIRLPDYSPSIRRCVVNVVATWLRAVVSCGESLLDSHTCNAVVDSIVSRRVPCGGWPFEAGSSRVDLLHQGYVLNGLRGLMDSGMRRDLAIEVLSPFFSTGGPIDKIDVATQPEAISRFAGYPTCHFVPGEHHWLVLHRKPARIWSLGESILTFAGVLDEVGRDAIVERWIRTIATDTLEVLKADRGASGPRHTMHVALGFARMLRVFYRDRWRI